MTKEEVINTLGNFKRYISGGSVTDKKANEAIDIAIETIEALKEKPIVRCKKCKHRYDVNCPMYYEEWFTINEGEGYYDNDFRVIDNTQNDGFCHKGERLED